MSLLESEPARREDVQEAQKIIMKISQNIYECKELVEGEDSLKRITNARTGEEERRL